MPSLTVENYVKAIHQISATQGGGSAQTGQLAAALGVSPGTVTSMLKTLSESGLATYLPYEGARLTPSGDALALRVLRRHRLIELFLAKTLDLSWDEVHEEAEHMEHAVSDLLVDRIERYLDFPKVDPHGDPIPTADGAVEAVGGRLLVDCPGALGFRLVRVLDQSPEFLRYLTESELALGSEGEVIANREESGVLTIRSGEKQTALSREAAAKLVVETRE